MLVTLAACRAAAARGRGRWDDAAVRRRTLGILCATVIVAAGCGNASKPSPPTGVDELVIPTPDPDPSDFVATVDNPFLPLRPGSTWEYDVTGAGRIVHARIDAEEGPEHDGITTTVLRRTTLDDRGREVTTVADQVAQDRRGNVWWLGRDGEWFDEAGLMMPAAPRLGDGFLMADLPDGAVHAEVAEVGSQTTVEGHEYDDVLHLTVVGSQDSDLEMFFARGTGLVATQTADGTVGWGLVGAD